MCKHKYNVRSLCVRVRDYRDVNKCKRGEGWGNTPL